MTVLYVIWAAVRDVGQLDVLCVIILAAAYGIFVGAIPGLTATMAVALMVPMTFFLEDVHAIAAIVTTVTCSIFAGDIPSTLIRIPGTPASAAYANDAYHLTQQGLHRRALGIALKYSVAGGFFGVIVLIVAAPTLAQFAAQFTSFEYFWLFVLGLTCAATVSGQSTLKACFALTFGMLLSTIGLGTDYSLPRMTFGVDTLITGINFIPAMIGLFGVSEILRNVLNLRSDQNPGSKLSDKLLPPPTIRQRIAIPRKLALLRSSTIGSLVGMLPGAGADIAAWISYAVSKRFSKSPEKYGTGSEEGLADATGANNSALGSAWIPSLVFGIPGDSVTAIAIGVLLMKNITPGPDIFVIPDSFSQEEILKTGTIPPAPLVYALYVAFIFANIVLIPIGLMAIATGSYLIRISRQILLPIILLFCIVGAFAMNGSYFDVTVMLVMGIVGFGFDRQKIPLGPVVLGIILGKEVEHRFIQSIMKIGSDASFSSGVGQFFGSWISICLCLAVALMWIGSAGAFKWIRRGVSN